MEAFSRKVAEVCAAPPPTLFFFFPFFALVRSQDPDKH